jgi:alkylated DNA nucleotide flippase Atl1
MTGYKGGFSVLHNEVPDQTKKLKPRGMISVYDEMLAGGRKARWATGKIIRELLKTEAADAFRVINSLSQASDTPAWLRASGITTEALAAPVQYKFKRVAD